MTISYPVAWPSIVGASAILTPRSVVAVDTNDYTLAQTVYAYQGQAWALSIQYPPLRAGSAVSTRDAEELFAAIAKLNGVEGTFTHGIPGRGTPFGTALGSPVVNGANQTGNSLITDGWTAGATLAAGDYFGLESRLYKNLNDATADGSGNATLDIWPSLRASPADNAALTTTNPTTTFRLVSEVNVNMELARIFGITIDAMEAL